MYNHARTLLLNQSGTGGSQLIYPGDELIPDEFLALSLPTYLQTVRDRIFGISPDRMMLNYRSRQLLSLIEATKLQSYVEALDPRITYQSYSRQLLADNLFDPQIQGLYTTDGAAIYLNGAAISPDASGFCGYSYIVSVSGGSLVIQRTLEPQANSSEPLVFNSGISQSVALPFSDYSVKVNQLAEGSSWKIHGYHRPTQSLRTIDSSLRSIGQDNILRLFGASPVEPYLTFYNCWKDHAEFAYRLGGIVLAYIYRAEEVRNGG